MTPTAVFDLEYQDVRLAAAQGKFPAIWDIGIARSDGSKYSALVECDWKPEHMPMADLSQIDTSKAKPWRTVSQEIRDFFHGFRIFSWGWTDYHLISLWNNCYDMQWHGKADWRELRGYCERLHGADLPRSFSQTCKQFGVPAGEHRGLADATSGLKLLEILGDVKPVKREFKIYEV